MRLVTLNRFKQNVLLNSTKPFTLFLKSRQLLFFLLPMIVIQPTAICAQDDTLTNIDSRRFTLELKLGATYMQKPEILGNSLNYPIETQIMKNRYFNYSTNLKIALKKNYFLNLGLDVFNKSQLASFKIENAPNLNLNNLNINPTGNLATFNCFHFGIGRVFRLDRKTIIEAAFSYGSNIDSSSSKRSSYTSINGSENFMIIQAASHAKSMIGQSRMWVNVIRNFKWINLGASFGLLKFNKSPFETEFIFLPNTLDETSLKMYSGLYQTNFQFSISKGF